MSSVKRTKGSRKGPESGGSEAANQRVVNRRASLPSIARALNLSISAVAQALRDKPSTAKVSEATRQRVRAYASKVGYRPNRAAQFLRSGLSGLMGVIHFGGLPQLRAQKLFHQVRCIEDAGYDPLVRDVFWSRGNGLDRVLQAMLDAHVEGVVVLGGGSLAVVEAIRELHKQRIPVVVLGDLPQSVAPQFLSDKRSAFFQLADHLLGLGRKRPLLITHEPRKQGDSWHAAGAITGLQEACAKHGLAKSRARVLRVGAEDVRSDLDARLSSPYVRGEMGMKLVLENQDLPDAILCSNDSWAIGALGVCQQNGVVVPDEIAITGCEDELASAHGYMPLTTVHHPAEALAEQSIAALKEMIQTGSLTWRDNPRITIAGNLIVRASSGAGLAT